MTTNTTRAWTDQDVHDALTALGDNPDTVAATLHRLGHRGCRGSAVNCPVANYLRNQFPDAYDIDVDVADVAVYPLPGDGRDVLIANTPTAVAEFIELFDRKSGYPELSTGLIGRP
jgi:hypothetical protein